MLESSMFDKKDFIVEWKIFWRFVKPKKESRKNKQRKGTGFLNSRCLKQPYMGSHQRNNDNQQTRRAIYYGKQTTNAYTWK